MSQLSRKGQDHPLWCGVPALPCDRDGEDKMSYRTRLMSWFFLLLLVYVSLLSVGLAVYWQVNQNMMLALQEAKAQLRARHDNITRSRSLLFDEKQRPVYYETDYDWVVVSNGTAMNDPDDHPWKPPSKTHTLHTSSTGWGESPPSWYRFSGYNVHISSAFLDTRHTGSQVRILAIQHHSLNVTIRCQFDGYETQEVGWVKAYQRDIHPSWPPDKFYMSVLYSCQAPSRHVPSVVLTVEDNTKPTKLHSRLTIPLTRATGPRSGQEELAICIKSASGKLSRNSMIEYIEFYRMLGVEKLVIYNSSLSGDVNFVLETYADIGIVDIVQFPLQEQLYNSLKSLHRMSRADDYSILQQIYLLSINDCLYRYMGRYRYLVLVDLDELLVPHTEETLPFLVQKIIKRYLPCGAYIFKTAWYFEDFNKEISPGAIDPEFELINRLYRTPVNSSQPKAIVMTENALTLNWHGAVKTHPLLGKIHLNLKMFPHGNEGAYVHHFRPNCIDKFYKARCDSMRTTLVEDEILPRYMTNLKKRVALMKRVLQP